MSVKTKMKTGRVLIQTHHVDGRLDKFIEVFPDGCLDDFNLTTAIPKEHKTCGVHAVIAGQSPLMVRKSYWDILK